MSVHDLSKKDFWIQLVLMLLLTLTDITVLPRWRFLSRARVMVVPPLFRLPVTSSEVTWITWSPLWCSTHLPNSEIFIAQNNAFFIATAYVVKDAADTTDCGTGLMGILFTFLHVSPSVQMRVVARRTNDVSLEVKNSMVLHKICGCHFCPAIFDPTKRWQL